MANGNLTTALADALWRVVTEPLDPKAGGAILVRETPNIDATVMQTLMATQLSTLTITSPVADGQTYTGLWVNSKPEAIPTEGDDRRWFTLRQTLTKVTDATTYITLPSTYLELYGKEALKPFALVEGTGDDITRMWLYLNPAQEATLAALAVGDITPPSGYAEKQRKLEVEAIGNRTLTLTVLFRKVTWSAWSNTPTKTSDDNPGRGAIVRTKEWHGIRKADQATAKAYIEGTADSLFSILQTNIRDNQDGSLTVVQTTIKQLTDLAATDGSLKGQRVIDPLGLKPRTISTLTSYYDNVLKADLPSSDGVPAGYSLATMRTDVQGNGLYSRAYVYEKMTGSAWGEDGFTMDHYNCNSERDGTTREWLSVRIVDMATALTAARDATGTAAVPAGTFVVRAEAQDLHDGTAAIRQTYQERINRLSLAGQEVINALGLEQGTVSVTEVVYSDFTQAGLAAAVVGEAVPDVTWKSLGYKTDVGGNGLLTRIYTYQKVSWSNTTPTAKVTTISGEQSENDMGKHAVDHYFGVPAANAEAAVASLAAAADSTWRTISASFQERGNGEAVITRSKRFIGDPDQSAILKELTRTILGTPKGYVRSWFGLTAADANTKVAALAATTEFVITGVGAGTYKSVRITRETDSDSGLVDVIEVGDNVTGGGDSVASVYLLSQTCVTDPANQSWVVTLTVKRTTSTTAAVTWAGNSSTTAVMGVNQPGHKGGSIQQDPKTGIYIAVQENWTKGSTYTGSTHID